jgi:hypothetical protein
MRFHSYLKQIAYAVFVVLIFGCQKEMKPGLTPASLANNLSTSSNCKPVGLGMLVRIPNQPPTWYNLMLKWYDGNGKLKYLKSVFDELYSNFPNIAIVVDYAEVIYDNDFVYLNDAFFNKTILKVKLDAQGRPVASWFDGLYHGHPRKDTTYLYYSSSGRLDSFYTAFKIGTLPQDPLIITHTRCEYDNNGNILHLVDNTGEGRMNFYYDYNHNNPGLVPHYVATISLKLLEHMELFEFPHNNLLVKAASGVYLPGQGYPDDTYPVYIWNWVSPQNNSTGQIFYYEDGIGYPDRGIFYSAWECGGTTLVQSKNPTQSEFMRMIH